MTKTSEEVSAAIRKAEAQAAQAEAQARKAIAEAEIIELGRQEVLDMTRLSAMRLAKIEEEEQERQASDSHHRVYRFLGEVTSVSARAAVAKLVQWHRIDPECKIIFVIDSPGGGIIEGFHLFDTIQWLRSEGHHITTIAQGMAASMGGVLLQAGDERVMGPLATMLIHEASFMAYGSFGAVEDTVEFVKKLQDKIIDIFAARSSLSKVQIRNRWRRKNWWLTAEEALDLGFIDRIA